jgi:hypothetical protein
MTKDLLLFFSLAVAGLGEAQFNLKSNVNTLQNAAWWLSRLSIEFHLDMQLKLTIALKMPNLQCDGCEPMLTISVSTLIELQLPVVLRADISQHALQS